MAKIEIMKSAFYLLLTILTAHFSVAQSLPAPSSDLFTECKINFEPSLTALDLEQFTRQYLNNCDTSFELDKVVQTEKLDQQLMRYNPQVYAFNFRPTIQNLFDTPTFQLGNYDEFEQQFRFSNPAFYEANNNTVLSSGYQSFVCPSGGINF